MICLLAYGSLMDPDEVLRIVTGEPTLVSVRLHGFRRSFCQEPSWRESEGEQRGVLTIRPAEHDWLCAVLVGGCAPEALRSLDHRERGYERVQVPRSSVQPYSPAGDLEGITEVHLYRGRPEKASPGLHPNPEYLALCLEAARRWGPTFLDDFLTTTYIGERTLAELGCGPPGPWLP